MLSDEAAEDHTPTQEANNALTSEQLQHILNSVEATKTQHEHANMSTDLKLLELIATLTKKVSALEGNVEKRYNRKENAPPGTGRMAWRRESPKEGEPLEKMVDGKRYKHCRTCRKGDGLWTTGEGLHGTSEHDPDKSRKK